jgi:hypothetical protein
MADESTVPELDDNGQPLPPKPADEGVVEPPKPTEVIEDEDEDIDDPVIPVRSNAAHIIARKNRQIEKLRSKHDEPEILPDDDDDDDSRPLTRSDLKPLIDTISNSTNEKELKELFTTDPDSKKYEKRIKAFMDHPSWQGVPVSAIYHHLAFEAAAKIGAKKRAAADLEASQSRGAGNPTRPPEPSADGLPTPEEIASMSEEEILKMRENIRTGGLA